MTSGQRARSGSRELSLEHRMVRRIQRLVATSVVALGLIWALARATLAPGPVIELLLIGGWFLMPSVLLASLSRPWLRYALVAPATLIGTGLLTIAFRNLPSDALAAAGWLLITAGVVLGGVMGAWFWYRLLPVPAALDDPFSRARILLIAVHVGLIVSGLLLASAPLVAGWVTARA